jgi:hypothetical protein
VIVVEPWLQPGVLDTSRRFTHSAEANGVRVIRHSQAEVEGTLSRLRFEYEIEEHGATRRVNEVHELGLFTPEEMMRAFRNASLDADYDAKGLTDRGLFVARRAR